MEYRYLNQADGAYKNYYQDSNYQQPATQSPAYPTDGSAISAGYGTGYQDSYNYDSQYQDPGAASQYQESNYVPESTEPSLSDYNSHESCVKITTKK